MKENWEKKRIRNIFTPIVAVILAIIFIQKIHATNIHWDWKMIPWAWYPKYIFETLKIATISCVLGIVVGIPFGLGKTKKNLPVKFISSLYIGIFKGVPLLVQLFMAWGVLTLFFDISNYTCGVITLGGYASFKAGEMIESTVNWYNNSTKDPARSKNDHGSTSPSLIKRIACVFLYLYIHLIKESSLLSIIAVPELFGFTRFAMLNFSGLEALLPTALIYILLVCGLSKSLIFIRKKLIKDEEFFNSPGNIHLWS